MNYEDLKADSQMYLQQIIELSELMLENNKFSTPNIMTLRDLAQNCLEKIDLIKFN